MVFEKNPISSNNDLHLEIDINSSDIIIQAQLISRIIKIFNFQSSKQTRIEETVRENIQSIKRVTRIQASHLLDVHKKNYISINAKGPRIIFIENTKNINSTLLIIDTGNLLLKSELPSNNKINHSRLQDHLYDRLQIQISSLKVNLYANNDNNQENTSDLLDHFHHRNHGFPIIDEIKITLMVGILFCSPSEILSKIIISGYCTEIRANINSNSMNKLLELTSSLIKSFQNSSSTPKSSSTIKKIKKSSTSNHENLPKKSKKEKKQKIKSNNEINEKIIDCHFSIHHCSLYLLDNNINNIKELNKSSIICFSIQSMEIQCMMRTLDIYSLLEIQKISINDCLQKDGFKYQYLLSSENYTNIKENNNKKPIICIAYQCFRDQNHIKYRNIDNILDISIQKLFCCWNRDTIIKMIYHIELIDFSLLNDNKNNSKIDINYINESDDIYNSYTLSSPMEYHENEFFDAPTFGNQPKIIISNENQSNDNKILKIHHLSSKNTNQNNKKVKFQLFLTIESITLNFNKNGKIFSSTEVNLIKFSFEKLKTHFIIRSSLFNIYLDNRSNHLIYTEENKNFFSLQFIQYDSTYDDYPNYKQKLSLHMNSIYFTILPKFFIDFLIYFDEMISHRMILKLNNKEKSKKLSGLSTSSSSSSSVGKKKLSNFDKFYSLCLFEIFICSPHILIPCNSFSPHFIKFSIGNISIFNKQIQCNEKENKNNNNDDDLLNENDIILSENIIFSIHDSFIKTCTSPNKEIETILSNLSFSCCISKIYVDPSNISPKIKINGELKPIEIQFSEQSYSDILNTFSQISNEFLIRLKHRKLKKEKYSINKEIQVLNKMIIIKITNQMMILYQPRMFQK